MMIEKQRPGDLYSWRVASNSDAIRGEKHSYDIVKKQFIFKNSVDSDMH